MFCLVILGSFWQTSACGNTAYNSSPQQPDPFVHYQNDSYGEKNIAHNRSQRIHREDMCTGKLRKRIKIFITNYDEESSDYALTKDQKMKYLHDQFHNESKQYFWTEIKHSFSRYSIAAYKMVVTYNVITLRNCVRAFLKSLSHNANMQNKKMRCNEKSRTSSKPYNKLGS